MVRINEMKLCIKYIQLMTYYRKQVMTKHILPSLEVKIRLNRNNDFDSKNSRQKYNYDDFHFNYNKENHLKSFGITKLYEQQKN